MQSYWFAKAIASVALWSFLLWLDPFGMSSAADKGSKDLFQRIYSPHYATKNQHRIFVVLFDDEDLPISGEGPARWPPDYSDFAQLLDRLQGDAGLRPAAVFVDILFDNEPHDPVEIQSLCEAIDRFRERDVPLVLAQLPDFTNNTLRTPAALRLCTNYLDLASVGWIADEGQYPLSVDIGGAAVPTVAARLHEVAVARGDAAKGQSGNAPFRILWGAESPGAGMCEDYRGSTIDKLAHSIRIVWRGIAPDSLGRISFRYPQRCAFHEVLSPRDLLALTPDERTSFAALLADSYIFVGADVDGIPDFIDSPVHGRLPGVFIHAMALDNMITLGEAYLRDAPALALFGRRFTLQWDIIVQTGLLLALAIGLALTGARPVSHAATDAPASAPRHFFGALARDLHGLMLGFPKLILFSLVVLLVACYLFLYLHWTPPNYGGVLIAAMGMIFSGRGGR